MGESSRLSMILPYPAIVVVVALVVWFLSLVLKRLGETREKAEKLDAIEALMRGQHFIKINRNDQYSIQPRLSHKGTEIVSEIMDILFPDEVDVGLKARPETQGVNPG